MAYRKTEKVLAHLEARRVAILDAAEFLIAKHGLASMTTDDVAARAKMATGSVYTSFANREEIWSAVAARALAQTAELMRREYPPPRAPANALARAIAVFYGQLGKPLMVEALAGNAVYRGGICAELGALMRVVGLTPRASQVAACAAFGAIVALYQIDAGERAAIRFVLMAIGIPETAARALSA